MGRTSRTAAAALTMVMAAGVASCGGSAGTTASTAAKSSAAASTTSRLSAVALAAEAGLTAAPYQTEELWVSSAATLGASTTLYVFASRQAQDSYTQVAQQMGMGNYKSGYSHGTYWLLSGTDPDQVALYASKLG